MDSLKAEVLLAGPKPNRFPFAARDPDLHPRRSGLGWANDCHVPLSVLDPMHPFLGAQHRTELDGRCPRSDPDNGQHQEELEGETRHAGTQPRPR